MISLLHPRMHQSSFVRSTRAFCPQSRNHKAHMFPFTHRRRLRPSPFPQDLETDPALVTLRSLHTAPNCEPMATTAHQRTTSSEYLRNTAERFLTIEEQHHPLSPYHQPHRKRQMENTLRIGSPRRLQAGINPISGTAQYEAQHTTASIGASIHFRPVMRSKP